VGAACTGGINAERVIEKVTSNASTKTFAFFKKKHFSEVLREFRKYSEFNVYKI
jgi:hypothetical protein